MLVLNLECSQIGVYVLWGWGAGLGGGLGEVGGGGGWRWGFFFVFCGRFLGLVFLWGLGVGGFWLAPVFLQVVFAEGWGGVGAAIFTWVGVLLWWCGRWGGGCVFPSGGVCFGGAFCGFGAGLGVCGVVFFSGGGVSFWCWGGGEVGVVCLAWGVCGLFLGGFWVGRFGVSLLADVSPCLVTFLKSFSFGLLVPFHFE